MNGCSLPSSKIEDEIFLFPQQEKKLPHGRSTIEVRSTPRYLSTIKFVLSTLSFNIILSDVNNEKYVNTPTVTSIFNIEGS